MRVTAGVIGSPIAHSLSPVIMQAAFDAAGLDWVFVPFEVAPGHAAQAVAAMRTLGVRGLSVTMPHKSDVVPALDACTSDALALGAVNCIAWDGDRLVGHNTDGVGLVDTLRIDEGFDPLNRSCAVVGAGGAARAAVHALAQQGAARVIVVNRSEDRAATAAALAGERGSVGAPADLSAVDLIVQATPVGMRAQPGVPFGSELLVEGQLLFDMVYDPPVTPLVAAARERGVHAVTGLGMLVHQAVHAFRAWTGIEPSVDAMSAAAQKAIQERLA